jgi:hypothetical protein
MMVVLKLEAIADMGTLPNVESVLLYLVIILLLVLTSLPCPPQHQYSLASQIR